MVVHDLEYQINQYLVTQPLRNLGSDPLRNLDYDPCLEHPGSCVGYCKDQPGLPSEKLGGRTAPTFSRGYPGPQTMPKHLINEILGGGSLRSLFVRGLPK